MATTSWLTIVVIIVYLIVLAGVAVVANLRKRKAESSASGHFGGSYSAPVVMLTTASTIFSGATVVGIPGEVANLGYMCTRWFLAMCAIVTSMLLFYPRLRRLAVARGYTSPNDFIVDRYRSTPLRCLTTLAGSCASVIYLTIQFNAFGGEINSLTGIDTWIGMVIFAVLVVLMEVLGGLNSVVFTDVIQASVMIVCFIILPFIIWYDYGLFFGMAEANCEDLMFVNTTVDPPELCETAPVVPVSCTAAGCVGNTKPQFLNYPPLLDPPSQAAIPNVFWFIFSMVAFPLNLHLVQRTYVARSDTALKLVVISLIVGGLIAYPPGIYMGITHAAYAPSWPEANAKAPAFFGFMNELQARGGFQEFISVLTVCSYLAAVMSTADSLLMGVSSTISLDIVKGILSPSMKDSTVVHIGTLCTMVQCVFGIVGGLYISPKVYGTTLAMSNGFLFQLVPAYLLGMYTDVTGRAVACGTAVGLVTATILFFLIDLPYLPTPMIGLLANLLVIGVVACVAPGTDDRDKDRAKETFGERLNTESIAEYLSGTRTPPVYLPVITLVFLLLCTPMWDKEGTPQDIILGFPAHSLLMNWGAIVGILLCLIGAWWWTPGPDKEPKEFTAAAVGYDSEEDE